jgi:small subunit ribosomal protein S11e
MAELTVQSERAFLKQPHIFQNPKVAGKTKEKRWYKDVGLGFKTPKEAIEGTYIGNSNSPTILISRQKMSFHWSNLHPWTYPLRHCCLRQNAPYHHNSVFTFWVLAKCSRDYLHYVKKYNRYEKRHKNLAAHVSPCFRIKEGDQVTVGQCRPLSKTVRFNVLKINRTDEGSKQFTKF